MGLQRSPRHRKESDTTEHSVSDRLNMAIRVKCSEVPSVVINNINFCHCVCNCHLESIY